MLREIKSYATEIISNGVELKSCNDEKIWGNDIQNLNVDVDIKYERQAICVR